MPRVLVQVSGRAALTGAQGEFSFSLDGLSSGMTSVQLTKPGYFVPGAKARFSSPVSNVAFGPDTGRVVLKLAPEAVIFGRVTGPDDEPLEGAQLQVLAYMSINDEPPRLLPAGGARSDEDGNFRIAGLPAGRYYVTVRSAGINRNVLGAQTTETNQAYPPLVYYPGTQELSAATVVDLAPGQRLEAPFSLALLPAYKVSGMVIAAGEWKRVDPPMILDGAGQTLFSANTFDGKTGAFEFHAVPAGTYSVRLGGTDPQDHPRSSDHKIAISKPASGLKFLLKPGIDIPVVIRTEFTKPRPEMHANCSSTTSLGGVQQSDCSDYPKARVELIAMDSTGSRFVTDYGPLKDPPAFGIHEVAPGKYLVRAHATFGGYVQSVRSGSLDLFQEPLTLGESGTVMPIEVVLRDDSATLQIAVRTEKTGASGMIVLYAEGAPLLSPTRWGSISAGTYSYIGPLAPGSYKVFAFDSLDGIDLARPDSLAKYASQAARVTLSPNHESSVIVDVIRTGD